MDNRGLDRSSDLSLCRLLLSVNEGTPQVAGDGANTQSPISSWMSSIKLITTTTADPAIPAKNMTSQSRMKKMATSIAIDCIVFLV
jgi:hypothetical protein